VDDFKVKPIGLLARLSAAEIEALTQCARRRAVRRDAEIVRQGDHNESLFFVQEGVFHALRRVRSRDIILGRFEPGAFFGEVSLFDPGPTTGTVRAITDGALLEIRRPQLDEFVVGCPAGAAALFLGLLEETATRLRNADQRFADSIVWGTLLK